MSAKTNAIHMLSYSIVVLMLSISAVVQADSNKATAINVSQVKSEAFAKPIALSGLLQNKSQATWLSILDC